MTFHKLFENVMTTRDVVSCYYVRSADLLVITGTGSRTAGAVIVDDRGQLVAARATKREALAALGCNITNN